MTQYHKNQVEELLAQLEELEDSEVLKADGYDDAILGVVSGFGGKSAMLYSTARCIAILMTRDGMDYEEAVEFFEFNTSGAYVGEHTQVYLDDLMADGLLTWIPADDEQGKTGEVEGESGGTSGPDGERSSAY